MVPLDNFLAFTVTAAVIVAIPGPSVLFTISRALTVGRHVALLTVVGNAVGVYLQAVATAFGMAAVVERSAAAFTVVRYLGAAYIVFLGVQAVRHRRSITESLGRRVAPVTPLRALRGWSSAPPIPRPSWSSSPSCRASRIVPPGTCRCSC